jgi:hypothetical protein
LAYRKTISKSSEKSMCAKGARNVESVHLWWSEIVAEGRTAFMIVTVSIL